MRRAERERDELAEFVDVIRCAIGLRPMPAEPAASRALVPYSLDGGRTFLTTRQWMDRLGVSRQRVHQRRKRTILLALQRRVDSSESQLP
jgi:hypothetical protein